jgi:hypothetical protein
VGEKREESTNALLLEPISLTSEKFVQEYYERTITSSDYANIQVAFEKLEGSLKDDPTYIKNKKIIDQYVLEPAGLLKIRAQESVCSWSFLKTRILMSPPAMCSLSAIVLGFIFPFKEWLFDVNNKPLPTFLATLMTLGSMLSPTSMFLLGASIAEGAKIQPTCFLRWKHIIISILVRFLILPLVGLLWIFVFLRQMDGNLFKNNPVLMLICYVYWCIPNGIILIATYAVADHYTMEFGIISLYVNIVAAPMMVVFLIIYFSIYETY